MRTLAAYRDQVPDGDTGGSIPLPAQVDSRDEILFRGKKSDSPTGLCQQSTEGGGAMSRAMAPSSTPGVVSPTAQPGPPRGGGPGHRARLASPTPEYNVADNAPIYYLVDGWKLPFAANSRRHRVRSRRSPGRERVEWETHRSNRRHPHRRGRPRAHDRRYSPTSPPRVTEYPSRGSKRWASPAVS